MLLTWRFTRLPLKSEVTGFILFSAHRMSVMANHTDCLSNKGGVRIEVPQ